MASPGAELSRRDSKRQETIAEIKGRARRQLADQGPGGLSLRAVSRDMRMSSAAIYRYFDNQSALITALCVDAYLSLGDELTAARDQNANPTAQWWAIAHAMRRWSSRNAEDFALISGTPIAGYHAAEASTGPAAGRAALVPLEVYATAVQRGEADLSRCIVPNVVEPGDLGTYLISVQDSRLAADVAPERLGQLAAIGLNAWASILGFLISEHFGNLPRLISSVDDLYDTHVKTILTGMGFSAAAVTALRTEH